MRRQAVRKAIARAGARNVTMAMVLIAGAAALWGAEAAPLTFDPAAGGTPTNRVQPQVTGDPRLGGTLTCGRGSWDDPDAGPYPVSYQWTRNGEPIADATQRDRTIVAGDVGNGLRCDVTATGSEGSTTAASTTVYPRQPTVLTHPVVTGDLRLGQTLSCSRGTWDDDDLAGYAVTRQWRRAGADLPGQTASTYTVTAGDVGHGISCAVRAAGLTTAHSNTVYPTAPEIRTAPEISGDIRLGGALSCSRGVWDDQGITDYPTTTQWRRDGVDILAATGSTYVIGLGDLGRGISCSIRAADLTTAVSRTVYPTSPTARTGPVIEGDPRLGRTLTCTRGTWDDRDRDPYAVSYEWYRNGVFAGEGVEHAVATVDVGKGLQCRVIAEGVTTASTNTVYPSAPLLLTAPELSGDPRLGMTLSCSRGVWDDAGATAYAVAYQWYRNGVAVDGATTSDYTVARSDINQGLRCRVTAAGLTDADSTTRYVPAPANHLAPSISGDPYPGSELTCAPGAWNDPPGAPYAFTYAWYRSGVAEPVATAATYTVDAADVGTHLYCVVTAEESTEASVGIYPQASPPASGVTNVIAPAVSGDHRLRGQLTCSRGTWNDDPDSRYAVSYRWQRNNINISGSGSPTYTVQTADIGANVRCIVTAEGVTEAGSQYVHPAAPAVLAEPAITGDPGIRRALDCSRGTWNDRADDRWAVTYRWLRSGVAIGGATEPTYTVTPADVGVWLQCEVRAEGLTTATSGSVYGRAPRALESPSISGDPRLRQTLTCSRGTWDDLSTDRYAVAYQWLRGGEPIEGATGATRVVTADDVDTYLSCRVRAEGLVEAYGLNSVAVSPPRSVVAPDVSGRARIRQPLSCSRGTWDDTQADPYAVAYQWYRNSDAIAGATSAQYTVTPQDVGAYLRCRVRAEDRAEAYTDSEWVYAPESVVAPDVSGAPRLNRTLTCSRGDWDDTAADRYAVSYQWFRNSQAIDGATGPTRVVTRDDVSKYLHCRVRAEDLTDATSGSVYVNVPQESMAPTIEGQPHLRGALTCGRGTWDDIEGSRYAVSHQWYRNGEPINGATAQTYTASVADLNRYVHCAATAEGLADATSQWIYVEQPYAVTYPAIVGIAHPRRELSCHRGEWNDSPGARYAFAYRWQRNSSDIPGADSSDYVVQAADVGAYLHCVVTAEGDSSYQATSSGVYPTWEPLRTTLVAERDAVDPSQPSAYVLRVRNLNPVAVTLAGTEVTLPGGFSYRSGTTSGALTADPTAGGVGSLTLRWDGDYEVPALADVTLRFEVTASSTVGDHYASAVVEPADGAFTAPATGQTARITVEGPQPAPGTCTVAGTSGPDVLEGTAGADVICGFGGDDVLRGGDGADVLWGGDGDDRLEGGAGTDTLRGGHGADVLSGGTHGDMLRGGGGLDTVTYATRTAPVAATVGATDGDDGESGEGDTIASDVEIVRGGTGADALTGGPGGQELLGRAGDDRLEGGTAADLLEGGDGNDVLVDADGDVDRLICGGGFDTYTADLLDRLVGCEVAG